MIWVPKFDSFPFTSYVYSSGDVSPCNGAAASAQENVCRSVSDCRQSDIRLRNGGASPEKLPLLQFHAGPFCHKDFSVDVGFKDVVFRVFYAVPKADGAKLTRYWSWAWRFVP